MKLNQKRDYLRSRRKKRGLTQKQVADCLSISRELYAKIEGGTRNPGLKTAVKIADFFSIDVRKLIK
ncbi:helix-turn-helix transcriptional regulator [Bacillus infantis]|uniref:Helix-turn-helix transcriptional regulator n=1 Tax=Bacillus infantis TaxID=324767 RepID=A0A5D4RWP7_9BACI|nr:helix-turn-helix transcriptional regulator [Bacillus infantis]TYS55783.1 helix-turn-helix transcriptional regulator [Bacillus infantis]